MASARKTAWLMVGLGLVAGLQAIPARAQEARRIHLRVEVILISPKPGSIDPRGQALHKSLAPQFRYESMRVLQSENLSLRMDQVGRVQLPNGRDVRLRPLDLGRSGLLLAVDVERVTRADLRLQRGRRAVFGAHPYQGGRLVISIEPDF